MATKGVWQLQKLTLRYCQHSGSSRYARDLIRDTRFLQFVKDNPQIEFHSEIKSGRHPVLMGDYVTKVSKVADIKNKDMDFVLTQMARMRNTSGRKMTKISKPLKSMNPSVQGLWEQNIDSSEFKIQHM